MDPIGDRTARLDQIKAEQVNLATIVRANYEAHLESGFSRKEALQLSTGFQAECVRILMAGSDDED